MTALASWDHDTLRRGILCAMGKRIPRVFWRKNAGEKANDALFGGQQHAVAREGPQLFIHDALGLIDQTA